MALDQSAAGSPSLRGRLSGGRRSGRRGHWFRSHMWEGGRDDDAKAVVPEITLDSDYSLFRGYLRRGDRIAFINNEDSLPEVIYHIAHRIQRRMDPAWKLRCGYVDKDYIDPPSGRHSEVDYSVRKDPALVLAIKHNRELVRCGWASASVSWLHVRYWRHYSRREYDGDESFWGDPEALLFLYVAAVSDAWLQRASNSEVRDLLTKLARTAREGDDSAQMLDAEDLNGEVVADPGVLTETGPWNDDDDDDDAK